MVGTVLEKAGHGHGSSSSSGNFNYVSRSKSSEPQQRVERWQMVLAEQQRQLPKQSSTRASSSLSYYIRDGTVPLACNNQLLPFTSDYSKKKGEHFCKASEQRRKKRKTAFYSVPSKQHTCCCSCLLLYISISMDYLLSLIMKEGKLESFPWDLKVIVFENFVVILCL